MGDISIKTAAFITAVSKYINIFLGIFFSAILSRILSPEDYGIVAIVTVFTTFFMVLSNCGLGIAVIQNKDFEQKDINTLFTFSFYFGLLLASLFIMASFPISFFYNNRVYIPICCILSISIFFNTINAVPNGILRRNKKFLLIGLRLITVSFFTYGITVGLALAGFKYYALVIQSVISSLLIFLWNLRNAKVSLCLKIDWSVIKKISGYSGFSFLFELVNYFSRNLDKLIIGKSIGNTYLAQYNKAYHFMLYPVQNLTNVISPVLHPILSDLKNSKAAVFTQYMKIVKLLSLTGVFVTAVCFCCSREIIIILYGDQWHIAVTCFKYLSFAIWTQMITGTSGSIFTTLGDTKRMFMAACINTTTIIIAIVFGTLHKNIIELSISIAIALNINFFVCYVVLIHFSLKESALSFFSKLSADVFILLFLLFISILLNKIFVFNNIVISLFVKASILSVLYLLLIIIFRQIKYFLPVLPKKIGARLNQR